MKPSRLFWKLFTIMLLAQVTSFFGVGVLLWYMEPDFEGKRPPPPQFEAGPPPELRPPPRPGDTDIRFPPPDFPRKPPPQRSLMPPPMPFLIGGAVSLLFSWLLATYLSRPIRTLQQAFKSEADGKLDTRIGAGMGQRSDELADLGKDFDRMAQRLQQLVDGQRRFLHDVSHELRSPLARLQAATELMQQQPERAQDYIPHIQRNTSRMDFLVWELLTLARLNEGSSQLRMEPCNLQDLVNDIAIDTGVEAASKQCVLEVTGSEAPITVSGDIELLRRAIDNLVRNAIRHSPANSTITLTLLALDTHAELSVRDRGTGVAPHELDAIFQPFFRSDSGRPFNGHGLGLAITRKVMETHGGTVKASNHKEGGLEVTLFLPLRTLDT